MVPANYNHYREICLLASFKLYTQIIEGILKEITESKIEEVHLTYTLNRRMNDNPFLIKNIMHRKIEENEELVTTFIDLKTPFDFVDWRISGIFTRI